MSKKKLLLFAIDILTFLFINLIFAALYILVLGKDDITLAGLAVNVFFTLFCISASRFAFRIYSNIWRYASSPVYLKMVIADTVGSVVAVSVFAALTYRNLGFSIVFHILVCGFYILATLTTRFAYRVIFDFKKTEGNHNKINVAIVGAGRVGVLLAKELRFNVNSNYYPYCFIDSNTHKAGNFVAGIKVYPENDEIIDKIKRMPIQEIFIALPKIRNKDLHSIYDFYAKSGLKIKIYDLPVALADDVQDDTKRRLREIKIEDLLFRDAVDVDTEFIKSYYTDKTILVTGGGGSIGSELCRQIAKHSPKKLIILDIYENNAYSIQQELIIKYADALNLCVEIASVRDRARLECIFNHYNPQIVFHAAAHKHVPLMEHSACEAIKNNIYGTRNVADMAEKYGVKKFVLVSTDKAVNPTNIMGASKRMCEMIVQSRTDSNTSFTAVRFGNVLASNGSVVPLFTTQIERGGPITLTDKRVIRYFMTIPEASQLVMYAGAIAERGDLFVLDMGKPVKILNLAENMIRLSGLTPYKDIDIVEIGLRPGEKLYEELLIKTETLKRTPNKKVFIERDKPFSREDISEKLSVLDKALKESEGTISNTLIKQAMKEIVESYHDPEEVNKTALESEEMKLAGIK